MWIISLTQCDYSCVHVTTMNLNMTYIPSKNLKRMHRPTTYDTKNIKDHTFKNQTAEVGQDMLLPMRTIANLARPYAALLASGK